MKVGSLKEYRELIADLEKIHKYLRIDQTKSLREIFLALGKLNFEDNFNSFTKQVTIPASQELAIRNELDGVPSGWIAIRKSAVELVDGDTEWNLNYVYLKNTSASALTATVVFFK